MAQELSSLSFARKRFIDYLKSQKRSISTILAYGKDIEQLVTFLESKKITQTPSISTQDLESFKEDLTKKDYTPKSTSRKLNSIKTFFRFLKSEGAITENIALNVSHPKYEVKPPRILSKLEYRALRDACRDDARISAIVELMLQTGIRIGEVARLQMEDVKENDIFIRAYESQAERSIPLNKAAKTALDRYITARPSAKSKTLFITKTGRPLPIRNIRTAIDRYFRLAGLKDTKVNDLRNTWIAYHLMAGTPVIFLSKLAGHKRLSTTERYLQYIQGKEIEGKAKLEEL